MKKKTCWCTKIIETQTTEYETNSGNNTSLKNKENDVLLTANSISSLDDPFVYNIEITNYILVRGNCWDKCTWNPFGATLYYIHLISVWFDLLSKPYLKVNILWVMRSYIYLPLNY